MAERRRRRRKLDVDPGRIVDRVTLFYETDHELRGAEREARLQRYAKFRMWTEGKDWPWDAASDVPLPDIMEKSLRLQDTLHNAVMAARPVIGAKAMEKANREKEDAIDKLTDHQVFVEQPGEEKMGDLADAFVNDGVMHLFIPWVKERRAVSEAKQFPPIPDRIGAAEYFDAILQSEFKNAQRIPGRTGWDWQVQVAGKDNKPELRDISFYTLRNGDVEMVWARDTTVYDGPLLIQKEWDEVVFPARSANLQIPGPSNPRGAAHVILVDYPTYDEVIRLAENGTYDLISDEDLKALKTSAGYHMDREFEEQKDTFQGVAHENKPNQTEAPEHNTVTRLMCFDIFDIDGDGITEDVVWWVILETKSLAKARLLTEIYPSDPPRRPLVSASMIPIRGRVGGISLPEMMEGLHDITKQVLDQTVDAGTVRNAPFFFYRPSGSMKPEIISLAPGEGYPLQDPTRDVHFPQFANNDQNFGINLISMMTQMEERLTTIGDLQLGRVPAGKSSALRTIGGMALVAGQGEARPERILRRFFGGLARAWSIIHELNQSFLPKEKQIRVIGLKDPASDPYLKIDRRQLEGRFEFDFGANVLNTSKMALQQSIQAIMGVFISDLHIQLGITKADTIYKLSREFAFAHGQDPDQYLHAPDPESMRPILLWQEAVSQIMSNQIPDGRPGPDAMQHLQGLMEFFQSDQVGLLDEGQVQVFQVWLQQVQERAAFEQQQLQLAQAAQQFGNGAAQAAPGPEPQAPLGPGEILDESLPGAGGGANQLQ